MASDIQDVTFAIRAQDGASAVFRQVKGAMGEVEKSYSRLTALFGGAAAVGFFTAMVREAKEAETQSNRLNAVLRATGSAAGLAKEELDAMADALAEVTQFDDESIRSASATLLKFGNIYKDVFSEALSLSADYAAFIGTDMPAAAQSIGKALSSPVLGLKGLQNELGRLSPEQDRAIQKFMEMGKVAEAQGVVLEFLRGKLKGAAAEMNTGFTGALASVSKSFGELMETIGKGVVGDTAKSFLGFLTASMRDMKAIIENGSWVDKLKNITLFMAGFRGMDIPTDGSRLSVGKIGGLPTGPRPLTDEQIKLIEKAAKEREELLKRGVASDEAAAAARYDIANQAYIDEGQINLKRVNERKKIEEQMIADDEAAWKAYYDGQAAEVTLANEIEKETTLKAQRDQQEAYARTLEAFKRMQNEATSYAKQAASNMQDAMATYFYDVLERKNTSFLQSFRQMLNRMQAEIMASKLNNALFGDVGKSGNLGGLIGSGIDWLFGAKGAAAADSAQFGIPAPSGLAFATGGSFTVGGDGGRDTTPVNFMATRGERVTVQTPEQAGSSGGTTINQSINVGGNVSQADIPRILEAAKTGALQAMAEQKKRGQW